MTNEQFNQFLQCCYDELQEKQEQLVKKHAIDDYQEYWYDQIKKVLQFKNDSEVLLQFEVVFVGTWAGQKNNWMWAWANLTMTPGIRAEAEKLKTLTKVTGFELFENPDFNCDEKMAYGLTALAVHHLNALGMFRIPGERSQLFLAIIKQI